MNLSNNPIWSPSRLLLIPSAYPNYRLPDDGRVFLNVVAPPKCQIAAITDPGNLIDCLSDSTELSCWVRHGEGMVGLGTAYSASFADALAVENWWLELVNSTTVDCDYALATEPMAAPVAFISFPFSLTGTYQIVVPQVVVGHRQGRSWMTSWDQAIWTPPNPIAQGVLQIEFEPGNLDYEQWCDTVVRMTNRIRAGQLDKVVLARDEVGRASSRISHRQVLNRLATSYPQTWTFCVANLIGASPELLVRQDRGLITSRVLAGTIHGNGSAANLADALSSSSKDLAEHNYAVASVAAALRDHVTSMHVPEVPFVLQLPNVMHLASDITAIRRPGETAIGLAAAIHPSAAVCGTPTESAYQMIQELESMDRGRYAGPVGWINAQGDGEIALALRCGVIEENTVRIFAGCGIVADSNPKAEWEETVAKLLPIKQALST